MNEERILSDRASRVKMIYEENHFHSVSEFARVCHLKQPTVANFMSGFRDPSVDSLRKIVEALPQYSMTWLMHGKGDKYAPGYANVGNDNNGTIIVGNSNNNSVEQPNEGMFSKLAGVYEKLLEALERCKSLEKQLDEANKTIEELKKNK